MPSTRPNLFDHARTDRCQDAFFGWLCAWADPEHATADPLLHRAGRAFIAHLYGAHDRKVPQYTGAVPRTMYHGIDLVVFLKADEGDHAILIEDKVFAGSQGRRMDRRIEKLKKLHPGIDVLPIHVQTCFIGHPIPSRNFRSIDLQGMLSFLLRSEWEPITDPIFTGYRDHLARRSDQAQQHERMKVSEWKADQWLGFFNALRSRVEKHGCSATFERSPRNAGMLAIFRMENVHLPEGGLFCVELFGRSEPLIMVRTNGRDPGRTERTRQMLQPIANANDIPIERPDDGLAADGATVATVRKEEFLLPDGHIDAGRVEQIMTGLNQILLARTVAAARASLVE